MSAPAVMSTTTDEINHPLHLHLNWLTSIPSQHRNLFSPNSTMGPGDTSTSCPLPDDVQDLHMKGTSHNILLYLSLACTAATLVSSLTLTTANLLRYRCPTEQRHIVRILFAPAVYAAVSVAEISNYSIAAYLDPIGDFYEAWCICSLYLLYIQFAAPSGVFGEELFDRLKAKSEREGGNDWPRVSWIAVFQLPITELVSIIILEATEAAGVYCSTSLKPKYGHLWSTVISSIGISIAVFSIIRFYGHMKTVMKARRGLAKLVCFKAIVGIRFIQQWIFSILVTQQVIKTSDRFTYGDLTYGLPNTLTCIETTIFSLIFWYAFSSSEYSTTAQPAARKLPIWRALPDTLLNPFDLLHGVAKMFSLLFNGSSAGQYDTPSHVVTMAPADREGRGRFRNFDVMNTLSYPAQTRERAPSQEPMWPAGSGQLAPGSAYRSDASPPAYAQSQPGYLKVDGRGSRSPSPAVGADGYRRSTYGEKV